MQARNLNTILMSWVHNKVQREAESQTRLAEDNVDRRKMVQQLSESDRKLLDGIFDRLNNQGRQNKECQGLHGELGQQVTKLKSQLASAMQDLENHIKVQNHTRQQLSKLEQAVGRISQQRYKL
jgi:chromosome segregation ATPase